MDCGHGFKGLRANRLNGALPVNVDSVNIRVPPRRHDTDNLATGVDVAVGIPPVTITGQVVGNGRDFCAIEGSESRFGRPKLWNGRSSRTPSISRLASNDKDIAIWKVD